MCASRANGRDTTVTPPVAASRPLAPAAQSGCAGARRLRRSHHSRRTHVLQCRPSSLLPHRGNTGPSVARDTPHNGVKHTSVSNLVPGCSVRLPTGGGVCVLYVCVRDCPMAPPLLTPAHAATLPPWSTQKHKGPLLPTATAWHRWHVQGVNTTQAGSEASEGTQRAGTSAA